MLGDISAQVQWPVNGEPSYMDREDWRFVFAAAHRQEKRIAQGLNGGYVVLGLRLRDIFKGMSDEESERDASDLITLVRAFGDQNEVRWSDPKESALRAQYEQEAIHDASPLA